MSLVVTPAYTWTDGDLVTATRLNSTATPTIADGQPGAFSSITATSTSTLTATGQASGVIVQSGSGTLGDQGGQIKLTNQGTAAPAPNKYFRVDSTGALQVLNSAYSAAILTMPDAAAAVVAQGLTNTPISGSTGSFTTLAASSTVSGAGFTAYFASPPAIGGTSAAAGAFTSLSATGSLTAVGIVSTNTSGAAFDRTGASTTQQYIQLGNTGGLLYLGSESSAGGAICPSTSAYSTVLHSQNNVPIALCVNNNIVATFSSTFVNTYRPLLTVASATGGAGISVPHGTAPSAPSNGDIWTTTSGMFVRINGVTKTVTLT